MRNSFKLGSAISLLLTAVAVTAFHTGNAQAATISQTFSYTNTVDTSFTVPPNIFAINVTMNGGQGGRGGGDSQGSPTPGGYRGVVTGTIPVTPGDVVTVAVGGGGGTGVSSRGSAAGGTAGLNPLAGYDGAVGGVAGPAGSSGGGGGGGAATVVKIGNLSFVAGGAGGNGGNGQYLAIVGRRASETHTPRSDTVSTTGRVGKDTSLACTAGFRCDGGASGAGGGGVVGGEQGEVQYGGATATEYFGFGGYPGSNSTEGVTSLTSYYEYYEGNNGNGSVVISYESGSPGAPTDVTGGQQNGAVSLTWKAPLSTGGANITDYVIQYSTSANGAFTTVNDGESTNLFTTVTGLTNGTPYFFRVAAVNSYGTSAYSTAMASGVAPSDVPAAPSISAITPLDGSLSVAFTAAVSGAPIRWYDYQLDGGDWVTTSATSSPVSVSGLTNGQSYSVKIRAVSSIGDGVASSSTAGTPASVPAAPSISAIGLDTGAVSVSFEAGANGGSVITNYQYSINNGSSWVVRSPESVTSPLAITGLTGGTEYPIRLRAVNAAGAGAQSNVSNVTVKGAPGAPSISTIVAGDQQLKVNFDQGPNGGSPVSMYQYSTDNGATWRNRTDGGTTGSPIIVTALVDDGTSALTNGTSYNVKIRAENIAGYGTASVGVASTPRTVPSAPSIIGDTISGSDGVLNAAFSAPSSNGGSVITNYQYSTDAGATWRNRTDGGTTASPVVISVLSTNGSTALAGGTTYFVELRAVNTAGAGLASAVATGITTTIPSAPTLTSLVGYDTSATVTFDVPANGGREITKYEYKLGNGNWTNTGTLANSFTISGLSNGTQYSVIVRAVNAIGDGTSSDASSVTPSSASSSPTLNSITAGNKTLSIAFSEPTSNGGSVITKYQYSTDGGATWRDRSSGTTASPLVITTVSSAGNANLVNAQTYTVQIRAWNSAGPGSASTSLLSVPRDAPDAPTLGAVTIGDGRLTIAFVAGSSNGSAILKFQYQLNSEAWTDAGSLNSPLTISGLTNGTSYSVKLRAVNDVGNGAPSNTVTAIPATPPSEPRSVIATSGNASAVVSWLVPLENGGIAISGYTATAYNAATNGSAVSTCSSTSLTTCTITSLTNGTTYYVSVVATNDAGTGAASIPRSAVTPVTTPSAPTITSITSGSTNLQVAFTAASNGGSSFTNYEYSLNGGDWLSSGRTTSPLLLSGLTNGTSYLVKIRAVTAIGASPESNALSKVPFGLPGVVAGITAAPETNSVVVSWSPTNDNGSEITTYTAVAWNTATEGSIVRSCTSSGTSCTVSSLSSATRYYFTVDATNAAGVGLRNAVRITALTGSTPPSAPTITSLTAGDAKVTVAWTAGNAGTSAITDYVLQYSTNGSTWTTFIDDISTTTSMIVTGLSNYVPYTFRVAAISNAGAGTYSSVSDAATPVGVPPDAPSITSVTAGDGQVTVAWTAGNANTDPISDYVIQYAIENGVFATYEDGVSTSRTAIVRGLTNGSKYRFKVAAVSLAGNSAYSTVSDLVTPIGVPPDAPSITSVTAGDGQVTVAWTAGNANTEPISDYVVQLSVENGVFETYADGVSTSRTAIVRGLTNGSKYRFKVAAVSLVGSSPYSAISDQVTPVAPIVPTTTTTTTTLKPTTTTEVAVVSTGNAVIGDGAGTTENIGQASVATIPKNGVTVVTNPMLKVVPTTTTTTTTQPPRVRNSTSGPAPDAPSAKSGEASALLDGEAVATNLTRSNNQINVSSSGISVTVGGITKDGDPIPLDTEGNLRLEDGSRLVINAVGYLPGEEVGIWLFSTPTQLAQITATDSGVVAGTLAIPKSVPSGSHRVVLDGVTGKGDPIILSIAVLAGKIKPTGTLTRILIGVPILFAVMIGLLVPARRRRRRENEAVA